MRRVCSTCGAEFDGQSRDTRCPVCRENSQGREPREHICRQCGAVYRTVGNRTYYCPSCAAERQKERSRLNRQNGSARKIGSTDYCKACGAAYVVCGGLQKYCPECADQIKAEKGRHTAIESFYNGGKERRDERIANRICATQTCIVCGKEFPLTGERKLCCSPECSDAHAKNLKDKWQAENADHLRDLNKKWWQEHGKERNEQRRKTRAQKAQK